MNPITTSFKVIFKVILIMLVSCFVSLPGNGLSAQTPGTIRSGTDKTIPVIELKGNGYERGVQHGKQLKKEIAQVYAKWKANIRNVVKSNPDSVIKGFLIANDFETISRKYTPWLLKELRGIADGSGQKYIDVFAFQLIDEFWVYLDRQFNTSNHRCSSIGVPSAGNHPAYLAQNLDVENYRNGYQVLFHISATNDDPEQYIVSCAGLVALNGMNEYGTGICTNTLMELKASTDGLPVTFVIRGVLNKKNGDDALSFLKNIKHASGQNYILGIADSVYDFEASSNQVVRFIPKQGQNSMVYHTNHALVNHDVKDWYKDYHAKVLAGETKNNNSEVRFASLEKYFRLPPAQISTDHIKTALRSKDDPVNPVCRAFNAGEYGFTFSSVLFTLGDRRSVQITNGPPDQSEYKEYFFKKTYSVDSR